MAAQDEQGDCVPRHWPWGTDNVVPQLLHMMIRVGDIDRTLRFYGDGFGMQVVERYANGTVTSLYLGFSGYRSAGLEIEHDAGAAAPSGEGGGFGHIAVGVVDMAGTMARLSTLGAPIRMAPTRFFAGGPLVALVSDPDGYTVECIEIRCAKHAIEGAG